MNRLTQRIRKSFARSEEGYSVVEYALLLLLISAVVLAAISLFGMTLSSVFASAAGSI